MLVSTGAALLLGCTTFVEPTTCADGSTGCAGIHDARFCENLALATDGADCETSRIVESKPFCVVTPTACTSTNYAVKGRDCRVLRYKILWDGARASCAPGTPMFVSR
jgi:hypothetical protein